jgi:hypothetical protein
MGLRRYAIVVVMMQQPSLCQIEKGKRMRGIRKIQTLKRSRTPVIPNRNREIITHYKCGFGVEIGAARVHEEHSSKRK